MARLTTTRLSTWAAAPLDSSVTATRTSRAPPSASLASPPSARARGSPPSVSWLRRSGLILPARPRRLLRPPHSPSRPLSLIDPPRPHNPKQPPLIVVPFPFLSWRWQQWTVAAISPRRVAAPAVLAAPCGFLGSLWVRLDRLDLPSCWFLVPFSVFLALVWVLGRSGHASAMLVEGTRRSSREKVGAVRFWLLPLVFQQISPFPD